MTLTELIEEQYDDLDSDIVEICKKVALAYAREIIPEEEDGSPVENPKRGRPPKYKRVKHVIIKPFGDGFNVCRTQILSRIEEDSK